MRRTFGALRSKESTFLSILQNWDRLGATLVMTMAALQLAPLSASAQEGEEQEASSGDLEEIVVTGSRVIRDGLQAPTPMTVVSIDHLENSTPTNLMLGVQQLPYFSGADGAAGSFSTPRQATLDLRNLGDERTLTLLDGRRLPASGQGSSFTGAPDVSLIPQLLVQRVDIVTGGASAAYGSDAVSGVVNFVLDTSYEGVKGVVQGGASSRGDKEKFKGSVAAGWGFDSGRGHALVAAEFTEDDGLMYRDRAWATDAWALLNNPGVTDATAAPGNPRRVTVPHARSAVASYGGLITSGPLAGTEFGPGGVPEPFVFGSFRAGGTMSGGDGVNGNDDSSLFGAQRRKNAFAHIRYGLSEDLTGFIEAMYSISDHNSIVFPGWTIPPQTFTIFSGNPYIPDSIQAQMDLLGLETFQMGRLNRDFAKTPEFRTEEMTRTVLGVEGEFGRGWSLEAYYSYGRNEHHLETHQDILLMNLYRASDAVVDPATGDIVCEMTALHPDSGNPDVDNCVPINLFGEGSPSEAAADYATGTEVDNTLHEQHVAAVTVNRELFSNWAGPVDIAFGAEYRQESAFGPGDPIANTPCTNVDVIDGDPVVIRAVPLSLVGKPGCWILSNTGGIEGDFSITEGFAEALMPLARDQAWARSLDFNGSVRYAHYDLSGGVTTWKGGLVYQPFEDLRIRATRSRDIRSGNITELFAKANNTGLTVSDPFRGGEISSGGNTNSPGNPDLEPENADTTAVGMVYQPSWLSGFAASVDWYDIRIEDAITSLGAQNIVNQCFDGATQLCSLIRRNAQGIIDFVTNPKLNASEFHVSGVDIEANYQVPLGNGDLGLRLLASYIGKLETKLPGAPPLDNAGSVRFGRPEWKANLSANYTHGPFSLFVEERYIGDGVYDNRFRDGIDIDNNRIPARYYTDVTAHYRVGAEENMEVFLTVNNVFDQEPPRTGRFVIIVAEPISKPLYDSVLRAFTVGVKFEF
jgi:outer membrane receptor protein involved in Fe transport